MRRSGPGHRRSSAYVNDAHGNRLAMSELAARLPSATTTSTNTRCATSMAAVLVIAPPHSSPPREDEKHTWNRSVMLITVMWWRIKSVGLQTKASAERGTI